MVSIAWLMCSGVFSQTGISLMFTKYSMSEFENIKWLENSKNKMLILHVINQCLHWKMNVLGAQAVRVRY